MNGGGTGRYTRKAEHNLVAEAIRKIDLVDFQEQSMLSSIIIYLHAFDKISQLSGIPGTLVRSEDDFVIFLWRNGKKVLRKIEKMLGASV